MNKRCKFCGETGLNWSQEYYSKTGAWKLYKGREPHKCINHRCHGANPLFGGKPKEEIKAEPGKRLYILRPRNERRDRQ